MSAPSTATPRSRPGLLRRTSIAFVALALALVACGGADGAVQGTVDGALLVVGTDQLRFEPDALSAPAGTVTFELVCERGVNHNLVIDDTREQVAACAPGQRGVGSVDLVPGTYVIVCTVPGHEAVMRGTLSVS